MNMPERFNSETGFNTPVVVLGVVVAILLLIAITLFLQGGFMALQAKESAAKTNEPVNAKLEAHRSEQQALITGRPRWLDEQQGKLSLPIDDAMDRIVEKHAAGTTQNSDAAN